MKNIFMIIMLLFLILFPIQSFATLYDYSVAGQFQINGATNYVTGNVTIDDIFMSSPRGSILGPDYFFRFTNFSLNVTGANGPLNFPGLVGRYIGSH
jgi:hypothetical protein